MEYRVLIVDDEVSIRTNFEVFLKTERYAVETAENYNSAMDLFSQKKVDLVIADILLGGQTGIEILKEIKKIDLFCPVIIITGAPNVKTAAEAVRLGAFDYLVKPIRKVALLNVVKHALHQKKLEEEKAKLSSRLEAIFQSLDRTIITVDRDLCIIEANEATKITCGFSPKDITGLKVDMVKNPCNKKCFTVLDKTLDNREIIREFRVECNHASRRDQVVMVNCSPLLNQTSKSTGAVLLIRDITRLNQLEWELNEQHEFHNIVGKSKKMKDIFVLLKRLSNLDTNVLITGESGTGKEMISRVLHYNGIRADKNLVTVNCMALSENLLESELFGHVKGAFTGAVTDKKGRFELADGGTIFLDEIGDLSPAIQLKLLRVLQEREFERVGDPTPVKVDVRLITATNQDLKKMIQEGSFREDLYYRLKVVEIELPPLRERTGDIPALARKFIQVLNKKYNRKIEGLDNSANETLIHYLWPGNIRELEHAIEHAFVFCQGLIISNDHLPVEIRDFENPRKQVVNHSDIFGERQKILEVLNDTDWNKSKAARILGFSRPTLYDKINKYGLAE